MKPENNIIFKPFWSFSVEETLSLLETNAHGLTTEEANNRIQQFGLNRLAAVHKFSRIKIFLRQFKSPLIFILIMAGALTLFLEKWADASVIFLAIVVNVTLGFYQENRAEEALDRLRSYIKERVRVKRDGREMEIDAEQLVPGDIIYLGYGVRTPVDARIISEKNFSVDESILTGESLPVTKHIEPVSEGTPLPDRKNMVFGGTLVVEGFALAAVTSTGRSTEIGKIAESVAETQRVKTPLQTAVSKLAWIIAGTAVSLISGILILGISRGEPLFDMFLVSAAVAVGAIPEALPIALTVVLAVGVERLARQKGIIRNLAAAETLGSTTVIITDKTGTLTQANMKLVDIASIESVLSGKIRDHRELKKLTQEEQDILKLAVLCADVLVENPEDDPKEWKIIGKAVETHIIKAAAEHNLNPVHFRNATERHLVLPFDSRNKFSVSLVCSSRHSPLSLVKQKEESFYVILGAPDILLERADIDKDSYVSILKQLDRLSGEGKMLLGVGMMPVDKESKDADKMTPDAISHITFVGLLCFYDPIRPGVPAAIKEIESSGVKIVMATGDLKGTALSVAKDLGWEISEEQVLTGEELSRLGDAELVENISRIKVFARVTPDDKLRIGKLLRQRGEVVGMTGDGVNDAPALKAVDIGIAVGSGSDVAKDVADLVLLDDNFETIATAIEEGRKILNNIRKSFVYLMSNSLDEIILIGGALLLRLPLPLTALQIIWVNFVTGSLPALSFAFDDFIDKKKSTAKSSKKILDTEIKVLTLGIGTLTSFLLLALYWFLIRMEVEETIARTFLFACFASYILFVAFSLRSLKHRIFSYNIFSNRFLNFSVLMGLLLIAVTIYVPFLQGIFGTTSLSIFWLAWLGIWIGVNIALVELVKWAYRN